MTRHAAMFDLDGTLLNTVEDLADAMNQALSANGLPTHPDYEDHKHFVGDGVAMYVRRVLPPARRGDPGLVARVTTDYRAAYAAGWRNKTRPYDGVSEMLSELGRRGVRLAILSNKPQDTTEATAQAFLPADGFEEVRGAREGVPLKPDPAAALAIAAEMGLRPAEFVYVGDTATDMRTARAAGMCAVGALWGFRDADELRGAGAERLIERPAQLLELV